MRKFLINYKTWLFILVFVSGYIILSVDLKYVSLIPSPFFIPQINKINGVFLALSYSVLAAYIFFYFSTVLPRKILIGRSKIILSKQVHWLLYELFVLINQILNAYDINKSIEEIKEKDLLHINGNVKDGFSGKYKTSEHWKTFIKKGKKFTGFSNMPFKFPDYVINNLSQIPEKIEDIRKTYPNFHVDETFSEILSSIETNKLIDWHCEKKHELFSMGNSSEEIYSLIFNYKRLKDLKYHSRFRNSYNKIHFYSPEEIEKSNYAIANFFASLTPIWAKLDFLKPCLVLNPEYEDFRAFRSILSTRIYSFDNKTQVLDGIDSTCVIILPVGIPKKIIDKYIRENKSNKLIISLIPNIFFTSKTDKFKSKMTMNGLYKIYYRSPITLFHIKLFRQFPTKNTLESIRGSIHHLTTNYSPNL